MLNVVVEKGAMFKLMQEYIGLVLDIGTLIWFVAAVRDKLQIYARSFQSI